MDLEVEELCDGVEEVDAKEGDPITRLPTYIPPRKGKEKVTKDLHSGKFMVPMPILPKEVVF